MTDKKYIGVDKPHVDKVVEPELHWSEKLELMKDIPSVREFAPRDYGDNNPADPEQAWL